LADKQLTKGQINMTFQPFHNGVVALENKRINDDLGTRGLPTKRYAKLARKINEAAQGLYLLTRNGALYAATAKDIMQYFASGIIPADGAHVLGILDRAAALMRERAIEVLTESRWLSKEENQGLQQELIQAVEATANTKAWAVIGGAE
jgi:hypothetical protein